MSTNRWLACALLLSACGGGGAPEAVTPSASVAGGEAEARPTAATPDAAERSREGGLSPSGIARCTENQVPGLQSSAHYHDELRRMALDPRSEARAAAAKALAILGDAAGVQVLQELVRDDPSDSFALAALVRAGDPAAADRALQQIARAEPAAVIALAYGFIDAPHPTVIARLRGLLQLPDVGAGTRGWARTALAMMGDGNSQNEVKAILRDAADPRLVVAEAAAALRFGAPRAQEILLAVLSDPSVDDHSHAAAGLGDVPSAIDLGALVTAHQRATDPFDIIWMDYAILRYCGVQPR